MLATFAAMFNRILDLLRSNSWLIAALLVATGLLHAIRPKWLTMDWPSVVLILVGAVLLFLPVTRWGELFQSLEFGKVKLLFRDTQALAKSVEKAEVDQLLGLPALPHASPTSPITVGNKVFKEQLLVSLPEQPSFPAFRGQESTASVNAEIASLLSVDKRMALLRIGIEIERRLATLSRDADIRVPERGINWGRTVDDLAKAGKISASTAAAILNFRNVRNQIIHPTGASEVPDSLTVSAVDSGFKLLSILDNV